MTLQEAVQELADRSFSKSKADNNNNNNNDTNTNNNNNNNNNSDDNNDNNNNTTSQRSNLQSLDQSIRRQETGLNSFDLDIENPESSFGSDLDRESLDSFASTGEATSLPNLGTTMAIGFSLGSLTQDNQIGEQAGTHWDPSLELGRDSFGRQKPKKKVSFDEATLAAYKATCKNDRQQNSQLRQLEYNNENCSENNLQQAWQHSPSTMQQQTASASEKELEHKRCIDNNLREEESLEEEDRALGSLEAQLPTTIAFGSPKHNNNTSNLGQDLKNKAAWGILIDTGAAVSLAPVGFAQNTELSPLECTLQLRSLDGNLIQAYGRRTVHLRGAQLSLTVSFVIADVVHASLGMDAFVTNQLSLQRSSPTEIHLVNIAGTKTKLIQQGHFLYLEAWSDKSGLSTCRGVAFKTAMRAYSMTSMELQKVQLQKSLLATWL